MRDDFSPAVIETLAKRVGHRCSNPDCNQLTSGPQIDPMKAVNVGVASHITAASPNGPRYDAALTPEQRKSIDNGIWLCQKCGKLIDNDEARYTVAQLRDWKRLAEERAIKEVEGGGRRTTPAAAAPDAGHAARIARLQKQMPELLAEMKKDLTEHPLLREFVLLKKGWSYWAGGDELMYYFEDHLDLESKVRILANLGLVNEITFNDVARFLMTEEFVEYLIG